MLAAAGPAAGAGLVAVAGPVAAGVEGAALGAGDAASYRYRSYCRIRPMSFVP
jgi:hypothetical protein